MRRFAGIVALATLLTAVSAGGAEARRVTVLVVTGPQPARSPGRRCARALRPGRGLYVSRQEALERLGIDEFVERRCGTLQRCPIEVFVSVPPLGRSGTRAATTSRSAAAGADCSRSDRTRIPGLVAIEDIGETVRALERGTSRRSKPARRRPRPPTSRARRADGRCSTDARVRDLDLALALIALTSLALVTREAVARGAIAFPLAALLLAIVVAALEATGPFSTTLAVLAAVPVALGVARLHGEPYALVLAGAIGLYGLVLAVAPEANSLSGIGPHPWNGGRFYITNQTETLLLAPALAAGATLGGWRLAAVAALSIVVIGTSETGADGGGLFVYAAAFTVLSLLLRGRRPSLLAVAVVLAAVAGAIALDAATGGSSHVVDTVRDGPDALWDAFDRRLRLSWSIVTSTVFRAGIFVGCLAILGWFAAQRRAPGRGRVPRRHRDFPAR